MQTMDKASSLLYHPTIRPWRDHLPGLVRLKRHLGRQRTAKSDRFRPRDLLESRNH